jgi:hypothetical protein
VFAGAALALLGCGLLMNLVSAGLNPGPAQHGFALLAVALGLGGAISRWPLRG